MRAWNHRELLVTQPREIRFVPFLERIQVGYGSYFGHREGSARMNAAALLRHAKSLEAEAAELRARAAEMATQEREAAVVEALALYPVPYTRRRLRCLRPLLI